MLLRSFKLRSLFALSSAVNPSLLRLQARRTPTPSFGNASIYEPLETRQLMSVNVSTYHYSNAETGANTNETILTQANVNTNTFGKVASMAVDGQIYAQPLVMTNVNVAGQGTHDIVLVATENDDVYAFDAYGNNPAQGYLWRTSLLQTGETTVPESDYGTTDITPQLGVTGTPVIDQSTGTMYLVGLFKESNATYQQRLYAINITNGANAVAPVVIAANVSGSTFNNGTYNNTGGVVTFSAFRENQRPALTLANGEIYIGWSSHGDQNPWHGWVMGYNAATLHQDFVYCDTINGQQGGIWMSGGGIAVDSSGNLYFTTGNGDFNGSTGNFNTQSGALNFSMSLEKLSPSLTPLDYFAPSNEASLSGADLDYGCANVILLTNQPGAHPNEMLSAGKWGTIYLNSSDTGTLGEFSATTNNDLGEANITSNLGTSNVHQTMVYWNGYVYLAGDGLPLEAFSIANFSTGTVTPPSSESGHDFGSQSIEDAQGGGLTVSSNGNSNGILWALDNSAYNTNSATSYSSSGPAVLYAYDASNLSIPLWSSASASGGRDTAGTAVKFQDPVVANGHVYIAGLNSVTVYGLLSTSTNAPTITATAVATPTSTTLSTNLTISATDPAGDAAPAYYWDASTTPGGAPIPTFSVNNTTSASATTATFYRAGNYTLTCTAEDPTTGYSVISSVNVTVTQVLSGVAVTPATNVINDGNTVQLTATATDQFGNAMTSQPSFTWSVSGGNAGGTVNSSGLYTAPASGTGTDTVTASSGSISGSATVTVAIPASTYQTSLTTYFNHFGIATSGKSIPNGGLDGSGNGLAGNLLTTAATWQSGVNQTWNGSSFLLGATTTANNTNNIVEGTGQTIAVSAGHYTAVKLLALHINGSATDSFTLNYTDGSTQTITQSFSDWFTPQNFAGEFTAANMSYRITSNGGHGTGPFYLYGYSFTPIYSKILQSITLPVDASLIITSLDEAGSQVPTIGAASASPTTVTGNTTSLSVSGSDPAGDASPIFTWTAPFIPPGAVAPSFSPNGTTAASSSIATFHAAGTYTLTATITDPTTGFTASNSVSVTVNQTLTSILVTPVTAKVYDGGSQLFTANAYDQFGNLLTSQPSFNWTVKPGGAGGSENASSGLYTAPATGSGTDTINASSGVVTGTSTVTVLNPIPTVISSAASNPSPVTGTTATLTALATDAAGDVKPVYSWATTNMPSGATTPMFSPNGTNAANVSTATFYKAGAYTFTVTITDLTSGGSTTSTVNVNVVQTATGITVTPTGTIPLTNGQTQQFSASAVDQFGAILSPQPTFNWSVLSGGGSVSRTGLYQAPPTGAGPAIVQAAVGSATGQGNVQVNLPAWLGTGSIATWNSSTRILSVTGATSIVADPGSDQPIITAVGSSAVVTINPTGVLQVHIGGMNLSAGASAVVTSLGTARTATNHRVLVLGLPGATSAPLLGIDSTSKLDLTDNDLVEHTGSISVVNSLLTSGFNAVNGGYWNGSGIDSSIAATPSLQTLGDAQPAAAGTFDNEPVGTSDVEVAFTYYGDATLDGHVDGSDYSRIDNGFTSGLSGFNNGDFNFDGVINGSDYTLIDNAYNSQGAALLTQIAAPTSQLAPATTAVTAISPVKSSKIASSPINLASLVPATEDLVTVTKIAARLPASAPAAVAFPFFKHKPISHIQSPASVLNFSDVKILN